MISSKRNFTSGVFIIAIVLGVFLAVYLKINNPAKQAETKATTTSPANTQDFFQKPGDSQSSNAPVVVPQTKSITELKQTAQSQTGTPADYNSLAMAYYKANDNGNALKTINEGLVRFPNDDSLLKTKDLIENILPNL